MCRSRGPPAAAADGSASRARSTEHPSRSLSGRPSRQSQRPAAGMEETVAMRLTETVRIRSRSGDDLPALRQLAEDVLRLDGYPPRLPRDLGRFIGCPDALASSVAVSEGQVVGHVRKVTNERDLGFAVHQLHETLRLLALDARDQAAALPDYVVVPDELAFNRDDCERSLDWLVREGQTSASVRNETLAPIFGSTQRQPRE